MIWWSGLCPSTQAGKATETRCDLSDRGGTLMMRRRMRPSNTASSLLAIRSMCQLGKNGVPGWSSAKARSLKSAKSARTKAAYSSFVQCMGSLR